jgi:predicted nucleotidyltransferase
MDLKVPVAIIEKYNIDLFIVFGSYAENMNKPGSDLDLAYKSSELLAEEKEIELLNELSHFYQRGDLDLVNLTKAEPVLKVEVAKKGRLLYGSEKNLKSSVFMLLQSMQRQSFCEMIVEKLWRKNLG